MNVKALRRLAVLLAMTLVLAACFQRGPNPANAEALDGNGPYTVDSFVTGPVAGFGVGFNQGTVYYPTDVEAPVGSVVFTPGYTATQGTIQWVGPRIASHGFVVMVIDTLTTSDFPELRAEQAVAARKWLSGRASAPGSPLVGVLDPNRYAYAGHSMGGGGSLEAGKQDPGASALIPYTGWNLTNDFSSVEVPSLVVGCTDDTIAENWSHSNAFYNSLAGPKMYLELAGSHFCPLGGAPETRLIGRYTIAFLKHAMDQDTRYTGFLCNGAVSDPEVNEHSTNIC